MNDETLAAGQRPEESPRSEFSLDQIDEICDRFEAVWHSGQEPRIEEYLTTLAAAAARPELLVELIRLDLEYRWKRAVEPALAASEPGETLDYQSGPPGRRPRLAEYVARYPELGSLEDLPASLIAAEYRARLLAGDKPEQADYAARFPRHREALVEMLGQVDRANRKTASRGTGEWKLGERVKYFGDYELLEEIARGGMGVVYKARQQSLNRIVALKMILAGQLAGEEEVRRFHAEAEAAANLDHPGIVPIYEVGEHEGQHFFSMGYVEGESLAKRLADGPLPPREAARLMAEVAEAVGYAHSQGVIHRDLKPVNILLASGGRQPADAAGQSGDSRPPLAELTPRITDFGLAKRVTGESGLTATGQVLGTPSYMPPEQASGKLDEIKETADVYSLGTTLYALLTGRPPFQAANPLDTLMQVLNAEPVSLRQLNPKLPRDLETICQKCLQKEPCRRYATPQEFADELRRYLAGKPIHARPIGRAARTWRWCKRQPVVAASLAVTILSLLLGTGISLYFAVAANREAREKRQQTEVAKANLRQTRLVLYADQLQTVQARLQDESLSTGLAQEAARLLNDTQRCPLNLRDVAWGLLHQLTQHPGDAIDSVPLRGFDGQTRCAHVSPDGKTFCTVEGNRAIRLWDMHSTEGRILYEAGDNLPNDQRFYGRQHICFSGDGSRLAAVSAKNRITVWDSPTGAERTNVVTESEVQAPISLSHDGALLAYACSDLSITLRELASGRERQMRGESVGTSEIEMTAFSPDGTVLVVLGTGWIALCDVATANERSWRYCPAYSPSSAVFSPAGGHVVSYHSGEIQFWDTASMTPTTRLAIGGSMPCVAISPDGKTIAASNGELPDLWDMESGCLLLRLGKLVPKERFGERVVGLGFARDGQTLTCVGERGTVLRWHAGWPSERAVFAAAPSSAFSPDGEKLVRVLGRIGRQSSENLTVLASDVQTGLDQVLCQIPPGPMRSVTKISQLADGRTVALIGWHGQGTIDRGAGNSGEFLLWDTIGDRAKQRTAIDLQCQFGSDLLGRIIKGRIGDLREEAFSPDGALLAFIAPDDRRMNRVWLWDVRTGQPYARLPIPSPLSKRGQDWSATRITWAPTGKIVAAAGSELLDRPTETLVGEGGGVREVQTSLPEGPTRIVLWNVKNGNLIRDWTDDTGAAVSAMSYSPDGRVLAAGTSEAVQLWDVETGQARTIRHHHLGSIGLAFSSDGRLLATTGDNTVTLWDCVTGEEKQSFEESCGNLMFSPDGSLLAGRVHEGIKLWDVNRSLGVVSRVKSVRRQLVSGPEGLRIRATGKLRRIASTAGEGGNASEATVLFEFGGPLAKKVGGYGFATIDSAADNTGKALLLKKMLDPTEDCRERFRKAPLGQVLAVFEPTGGKVQSLKQLTGSVRLRVLTESKRADLREINNRLGATIANPIFEAPGVQVNARWDGDQVRFTYTFGETVAYKAFTMRDPKGNVLSTGASGDDLYNWVYFAGQQVPPGTSLTIEWNVFDKEVDVPFEFLDLPISTER